MADFSFVTARLATGGAIAGPGDVDALLQAGVTHVVDCQQEADDTALLAGRMACLWIGVPDDGVPKPADWFGKGIEFALQSLARPKAAVYCHCAAGVNRGPSMAYAVLRALGLPPAAAEAMIRQARPQVGLRYKDDADRAVQSLGYA